MNNQERVKLEIEQAETHIRKFAKECGGRDLDRRCTVKMLRSWLFAKTGSVHWSAKNRNELAQVAMVKWIDLDNEKRA